MDWLLPGLRDALRAQCEIRSVEVQPLNDGSVVFSVVVTMISGEQWRVALRYPEEDAGGLAREASPESRDWLLMMLSTHITEWINTRVVGPPISSAARLTAR